MTTVGKDTREIIVGMKLTSSNLAENIVHSEDCRLGQDLYSDSCFPLSQQGSVLNSTPSSACTTQLSRSYVQQVSSVAWPKIRHGRPRSNSYPFLKRWSPLPRVVEEDESLDAAPSSGTSPYVSKVSVQKIDWTHGNLSQEWLSKINSLRSTLFLADSSRPKPTKHCRPRSNSFPFIKHLIPLPCVIEEEEMLGEEKTKMTNLQTPHRLQSADCSDRKLPNEPLNSINLLRVTLSEFDYCSKAQEPSQLARQAGLKVSSRQDVITACERTARQQGNKIPQDNNLITMQISHIRKPDSTYISLISGFTQEASKQERAQSRATDSQLMVPSELKGSKNCKKLKCIAFSPRKLICSSPRQNPHQQISNSSEYVPHMGC